MDFDKLTTFKIEKLKNVEKVITRWSKINKEIKDAIELYIYESNIPFEETKTRKVTKKLLLANRIPRREDRINFHDQREISFCLFS